MIEVFAQNIDNIWFAVALNKELIVTSSFGKDRRTTVTKVMFNVPLNFPFQVFHEPIPFAKNILATLKSIHDGKEINTNLSLATAHLPTYTKKVLKITRAIPLGYATSYGEIARAVGGGPRAVGNIMASNPFAPIVPCHRVVRADFSLGGYGFGLKTKLQMLEKEKRGFSLSKEIEINHRSLMVYPAERVLRNYS
jgi:O-6-methylguanine DNA methyltransferase